MEEKLFCSKHAYNITEYYCAECNEFICPYCALSNNHINHINKIKTIEDIIKQKIENIDDNKNISLYKTIEIFQFIINYNSLYNSFNYSIILSLIKEQFDGYIGKIIELKMEILNLFSKEIEIISSIHKKTKKSILETQQKLLLKINDNNNKKEYLEKLNLCSEKIRLNKNQNEVMKYLEEYQSLINNCFESNDDLNEKYNYYLSYKYLNDISLNFKDKFFNNLIQPYFKNSLNQLEGLINKLKDEEKLENEKIKSELNKLNKVNKVNNQLNNNKDDIYLNDKKEVIQNELKDGTKNKMNNNINIQINKQSDNQMDKIKMLEKNQMKKKEENILKKNNEVKTYQKNVKEIKKEGNIESENLKEENLLKEKNKENKQEIKNDVIIKNENSKEENGNKKEVINNLIEEEKKEKEINDQEEIKKQLENKSNILNNLKNNNSNIGFEPPEIEGGKMTEEELNNLKENEEEQFLKKAPDSKELANLSNLENEEVQIVEKLLNDLDEDRLDIQYYEGIKFLEDEKGELNDNAYLEDEEKKDKINENEQNDIKENEKINEDQNKINNIEEKKEEKIEEKKEDNLKKSKKKNTDLNALFGVDVSKKINNQKNGKKEETNEKKPSLNLETWVNIDTVKEETPKKDNKNEDKRTKRNTVSKKPSDFKNIFGVSTNDANKINENKKEEKQKEKDTIKEISNQNEEVDEEEKEIVYEEPKIPAPKNKDSLQKFNKIYELISKEGKSDKKFIELFNSLTWEEKNYIEIIGLKQSDSKVYVYNQLSDKIDCLDIKIKFPSLQSFVNVPPYVYFCGGKIDNKPITLIRRLRKINNKFKIEEMGNMKEARSHHTTIYIKSLNSIIFISGTKTKTCEKLNLINKKVENFPSLNIGRERCGACLTNNEDLYIFFGFDKSKQKFESTIEKINIINQKKWSVLSIKGDKKLLKRYSMACIPFNFTNKQGIIIVGGVGNLRNDLEDTIFIELDTNNVKKFNVMPFGSSFTNPIFLPLTLGTQPRYIYNITNENEIISFNLESCQFSGLEQ